MMTMTFDNFAELLNMCALLFVHKCIFCIWFCTNINRFHNEQHGVHSWMRLQIASNAQWFIVFMRYCLFTISASLTTTCNRFIAYGLQVLPPLLNRQPVDWCIQLLLLLLLLWLILPVGPLSLCSSPKSIWFGFQSVFSLAFCWHFFFIHSMLES